MTSYVMHREVCLKHRKIRRENFLRVRVPHRTGSGVCFHIWMRPSFSSRIPGCQPGDAGAIPVGRTKFHIKAAGASLRSARICRSFRGLAGLFAPAMCTMVNKFSAVCPAAIN